MIARFEAERQALALMDHPNIARVFDGGATETGRPYFVTELVRGIRILPPLEKTTGDNVSSTSSTFRLKRKALVRYARLRATVTGLPVTFTFCMGMLVQVSSSLFCPSTRI